MKKFLFLSIFFLVFYDTPIHGMGRLPTSYYPEYLPGELLIKFKPGVLHRTKQAFHARIGARHVGELSLIRVQRIKIPVATMTMEDAIEYYRNNPEVEYVEPNYIVRAVATPDDPQFNQLWGLNNTGQTGGTEDADIDAPEAWDIHTGSSDMVIAVIDTGVAYNHGDLNDGVNSNIWTNDTELNGNPGVDDDGNGYVDDIYGWDFLGEDSDPTDYNGHGTHVAGTIAALGDNGTGITGVNWTASIMPLRFLGPLGYGDTAKASEAILYAANNGAKVINASWGGGGLSQTLYDAISYANDRGCLFVVAAGNAGDNNDQIPFYPASYNLPNIIAVAATDHNDNLASFSNFGVTSVDVAAPGVNVLSSVPSLSLGPEVQLFSENFESGLGNWTHWGTNDLWELTDTDSVSPTHSLADSPLGDYLNNTDSYITYDTSFNLVDKITTLEYKVKNELESGDYLFIGGTISGTFVPLFTLNLDGIIGGSSGGNFESHTTYISLFGDLTNNTNIGFNLFSNASNVDDGVYIDDVIFKARDLLIAGYDYIAYNGTSMAAPHVAGLAALIWAEDDSLTHSEVKERILNGVEVKTSLKEKTLTGGRINAYNSLLNMPASPSNLSATAVSSAQINLSWSDNCYGETGFKIQRKTDAAAGVWTQIAVVGADETSYADTSCAASTTYYYQVFSYNPTGDSPASNEASTTTPAAPVGGGGGGGGCFVTTATHL